MTYLSRRRFLQFMGASSGASMLSACSDGGQAFQPLLAGRRDEVALVQGLNHYVLIGFDDVLNRKGDRFGYDNDYIACLPGDGPADALLWVNHESIKPFLMNGWDGKGPRNPKDVAAERLAVGGAFLKLARKNGRWSVVFDDPQNRRIHADTPMPFKGGGPIQGASSARGTLANCAGGVTPWQTILTCEENYYKFYGEVHFPKGVREMVEGMARYGWEKDDPRPPEHYGWVVEIDPKTGDAAKLLGLGRFAHECATAVTARDGRCVVYSGDDTVDECLYKFISDKPGSLETGKLYVADVAEGRWILLDHEANPALKGKFKSQTEMLIRTREAAHMVGGSPLARPEDIEIHPATGDVYICLTNNDPQDNFHGHITRVKETGGDYLSMTFRYDTFLAGGEDSGFSSPDNLVFDKRGNLWFTCDVSESKIGTSRYAFYGNNALFYVPMSGPDAGKPLRMANAPHDAEFTGPCFSPDGEQLFLSVQHPGARSSRGRFTSHWPDGGESKPRPAVIVIDGPLMTQLMKPTT